MARIHFDDNGDVLLVDPDNTLPQPAQRAITLAFDASTNASTVAAVHANPTQFHIQGRELLHNGLPVKINPDPVGELPALVGPAGPAGEAGQQGPQGLQGIPGTPGLQGAKGDTGDTGPTGQTGQTGPQGIPGLPGVTLHALLSDLDTDTAPTALHHTLGTTANKAAAGNHNHDSAYSATSHTHPAAQPAAHKTTHATGGSDVLTPADIGAAVSAHNHDASYYTEAESDAKYALVGHTHAGGSGIPGTRTVLASDVTNNNAVANTIADVTGLSFAVTSGQRYWFRFFILYTAAATTTGSRWSINGPATSLLAYRSEYTLTAATQTINEGLAGYNLPAASSASSLTAGNIAQIEGIITPSANGTVIARFASEVASSAIVAKAGSYVEFGTL